jgi:hypothetical protein
MADLKKFEEMLERLVNEDKEGAEELFHEIVVEKSRDIYESLLESDLDIEEDTDEEVEETTDEEVDEATDEEVDEDEDKVDENFDLDEFEVEADPMDMGGDAADDMMADLEGGDDDEEGDDEDGEDGDMEDRVMDLEDALDDLKAEFEKMMDGEEGEGDDEEAGDDEEPEEAFAFEASDEEVEEATDEEVEEATDEEVEEKTNKSAGEEMREYVEKVSAKMGDNGANSKSTVAGANNMGGSASNLNQAATASDPEAGAGSTVKGSSLSDTSAKDMNTKNVNVPGGKASKAAKTEPGHGAEKKGKPETADNKKSTVGK